MEPIAQRIAVPFRYPVYFTSGVFDAANPLLASLVSHDAGRLLPVLDAGLCEAHPHLPGAVEKYCRAHDIKLAAAPLLLPGGEAVKNDYAHVQRMHEAIERAGMCRQSFVLAVGGGALLDAVGYAASTAHRGIRLIRVPTTVLAQDDSGIGVKNGINAFGKKNFLGVFAPPYAVLNDAGFLATLSDRDWRSGVAEAVKVALVKDAAFFEFLEEHAAAVAHRDLKRMEQVVYRCAELHLQHIAANGDPFETGSSRPLDFGHWSAHKLEQMTDYRLRHGEAVAIGIAIDATYARITGMLPEADWARIIELLERLGFELWTPELAGELSRDNPESLLHGLVEFREHIGGPLTILLPEAIGRMRQVHEISDEWIAESVQELARISKAPLGAAPKRGNDEHKVSAKHTTNPGRILL